MHKVNYDMIRRFFEDDCSEEERMEIMRWVNQSEEHASSFFKWEQLYHLGKLGETDDASALRKAEKKLDERIRLKKDRQLFFNKMNRWIKYAAVIATLFAVAGVSSWYFLSGAQEDWLTASTAPGETRCIILPDDSKVWLNENSTLTYPRQFRDNERRLRLNGEAYFEVTKNKHRPFTVQGKNMDVQVLGTKFNFKNATGCRIAEASLIEGEVKVCGNRNEGSITLSPGQKVELNTMTKQMKVSETDAVLDAIWHDNLIPLKQADIFSITRVLEKVYGVEIILSPDVDRSATYSGVLKRKDSVEEVLNLLRNSVHLNYKIHQNTIFISSE